MATSTNRPRYSLARSPGQVTLTVPGNSCRRHSSQSTGGIGDDVSGGFPVTYPSQPSVNGSMACLNVNVPLSHIDFWPACRKNALMACDATFEPFE
ncbi:hypothetical protein LSH36_186g02046 [Paralvinella palmiformis]|uniref:Uncharacterized protein n=1 Tax=Paralvinella palmiformis TaxID=53620 RepID=A0AAD9JQS7_9ANNE|nr:hypothetical protein LSH36_186g02046 [Paralvinella palmiformis]